MRKTIAVIVLALFSLSPVFALAQDANEVVPDAAANAATALKARSLIQQLGVGRLADDGSYVGQFCAFAQIQGPADSFNIQPVITNYMEEEVTVAMVNVFLARGAQSLLIDSVFALGAPTDGTLVDEYPNGMAGVGPALLVSTDWGFGESIYFNLDPDTYDDPAYGATVAEMTGARIMLVYEGDRRCAGIMWFNAGLDAAVAYLKQTSPAP